MPAIVYLDADDEITSAAARLRTLSDERIALVLPLGSRLATSRINFRLLAREAAAHRKTLDIVTGDASTRALAASAGLATHPSVAAFEGRDERPSQGAGGGLAGTGAGAADVSATAAAAGVAAAGSAPGGAARPQPGGSRASHVPATDDTPTVAVPTPSRIPALAPPRAGQPVPQVGRRPASRPNARIVAIALGIVVLLVAGGVAAYQFLPTATVTLTPAVDKLGPIQLSVTAQSGITKPDPTRLLVPARTFTFDVAVSDTFPTTGLKVVDTAASGAVTFTNCYLADSINIPAGSEVSTESGITFATQTEVRLKKATFGGGGINCSTDGTNVVATVSGTSGNVGAGTIKRVPPRYPSDFLFVTNPTATTGGTHTETKQVAQADVDTAMTALNDKLAASFDAKIAAAEGVPAGMTLFDETKSLGTATPTVDPKTLVGTDAATFQLGLSAKGTIVGADPSPVSTLADARIRSSVQDGFNLVEDSVKIDVGTPLVTGSTITFPVTATALATREVDVSVLRARIHGLGLPQARTVLQEFGKVEIVVWPDWVTTIPTNDDRLSFTITAPATPSASPGASRAPSSPKATGPAASSP